VQHQTGWAYPDPSLTTFFVTPNSESWTLAPLPDQALVRLRAVSLNPTSLAPGATLAGAVPGPLPWLRKLLE
jgi:hypothetical protein